MIKELIIDTLSPLKIPVSFQHYVGDEDTYITYFGYLEQTELSCDDEEKAIGHYIQVNIYSRKSYSKLEKEVKKLMKAAGFIRKPSGFEYFEPETKIYQKSFRFFYSENL